MIGLRELGAPPTQQEINEKNQKSLVFYSQLVKDHKKGKIKEIPEQPERILNLYNSCAWYQLLTGDFKGAEKTLREGIKMNPDFGYFPTNLAPALLFQGKFEAAKEVYAKYKDKVFLGKTYKELYLADFQEIKATGFVPQAYEQDMQKIITFLQ